MSFRHADAIKKYVNNARLGKFELEKTIVKKKRFWGKICWKNPVWKKSIWKNDFENVIP